VFVASGGSHAAGAVPDPGESAGFTRFLRAVATNSVTSSGTGTVTSVTFTGDGTVLSSTPSSAVTTSGTVTAALANQSANVALAGPTSGSAAVPTFRALVASDLPSGVALRQFEQVTDVTVSQTSGSTTLLSMTNAIGSLTIAAGLLNAQGRALEIEFGGYASSAGASPGNACLYLSLGGSVVATTATGTQATSRSNAAFAGRIRVTVKTTGSSGTIESTGLTLGYNNTQAGIFPSGLNSWNNASTAGTSATTTPQTVNLTGTLALDFGCNYASAVSGNSITLTHFSVKYLA
jgi:hypothetical protein